MIVDGVGLVLEGGGMRCVFTAGVLDYFMAHDIEFPYVAGVSGGACAAAEIPGGHAGGRDPLRHPGKRMDGGRAAAL